MAGFSAVANVLLLVAPVSMVQISDRVLPSASHATLIALTGVAVFLLCCFGLLDWIRQRLMTRVALTPHDGAVDAVLAGSYHASLRRARQNGGSAAVRGERLAPRRRAGGDGDVAAHTHSSLW